MTSSEQDHQLILRDVTKTFGRKRRQVRAVAPISLTIDKGSRIGIIGESGSGKSTLARILVGLEVQTAGEVTFGGRSIRSWTEGASSRLEFRRRVQFVGQDTNSFDPRHNFFDSVAMPLRVLRRQKDPAGIRESLAAIADQLDLDPILYQRYPHEVSGGQRQRFALARALVVEPELLICDEVVSALDVSVQGSVLNLIKRYTQQRDMGLVFIAHGLPAVMFVSDDVIVMRSGEVVERGSVGQIVTDAQHWYTRQLMDAYASTIDS